MSHHELPPSAQLMQMVMGAWVTQSISAAAHLGLADHLAGGAKTAYELAQLADAHADSVHRLMRALSSLGIFSMTGDKFALTALGETLRSNVPGSMRNIAMAETDNVHWLSWGKLPQAIKEGRKMSSDAVGMEAWDYYAKNPAEGHQFSRAMSDISGMATGPVLASYDFSSAKKIVDVGGAHGALLQGILNKYTDISGVLFDLPSVTQGSTEAIKNAGLASRVEVVGGDFFKEVPAGADIYTLKHILHDWDDEKCVAILRTIRAAMKPTSKILVVEFALSNTAEPSPAHFMDLNMLVMLNGRERTKDEYATLFAKAGLSLARFIPTPSPMGICEVVAG